MNFLFAILAIAVGFIAFAIVASVILDSVIGKNKPVVIDNEQIVDDDLPNYGNPVDDELALKLLNEGKIKKQKKEYRSIFDDVENPW